jgi:threonine dehydratase
MSPEPAPISLDAIQAARLRLDGLVARTPLLRLNTVESRKTQARIYLKLENLQPIGSFKLRGAGNRILQADPAQLAQGVWTASAGNMAQGVAWCAQRMGLGCVVVVPETAPETKRAAIERLGARIVTVTFDQWLEVFETRRYPGMEGLFVHAFNDPAVMAGNGTIGLEILEDLPDVDAVVVPYGGGGLSCGIAAALRALKPDVKIYAAEVEGAAPLAASLAAGAPVEIDYRPSFVDGIGAPRVFTEMWPLAKLLLDGSLIATVGEVAEAVRLLAERNRVVAEGAGATPVAAALADRAGGGNVVCVVSGGNIDSSKLVKILQGDVP